MASFRVKLNYEFNIKLIKVEYKVRNKKMKDFFKNNKCKYNSIKL